jgi:hypothetical protein
MKVAMKIQFAFPLLAILLSVSTLAHAKVSSCAFGENTADLADLLAQKDSNQLFYEGEHLSIRTPQRLNGLTATERKMILQAQTETVVGSDGTEQERLESFASGDGYIVYFTQNSTGREFAEVGSFPGDNEFGVILELKSTRQQAEPSIVGVAAIISDGDLEDCKVESEKR